jgi:YbbR domain-containing protein
MQSPRSWITHNWILKILALLIATLLWMAVAHTTSSEIGLDVALEYRNIPAQLEITGDTTNTVQVRLRGSSNVINEITPRNVATTIDVSEMRAGEKVVALSPRNVQAPFGAEVIRVTPSSVRFNLERTVEKIVPVVAEIATQPPDGYEVQKIVLNPAAVAVQGPESRVMILMSISTVPIRLERRQADVEMNVDLDVPDPQIRLQRPAPVFARIEIRHKSQR